MPRPLRLLVIGLFLLACSFVFGQTPNPIPVTGNLYQISGQPQGYTGVLIQLYNCPSPITIPTYSVVVQTAYQLQANSSGFVNGTVWGVDQLDCNGTTGNSQYQVTYLVNGTPSGTPQCYQPVSSIGVWNLSSLQPITCTQSPPNPQDATYRNLVVTNTLSLPGGSSYLPLSGGTMTGPLQGTAVSTKQYPYINGLFWGMVPDFQQALCSITATQTTLTCTSSIFSSASVGKTAEVSGAGFGAGVLVTTIATYISPTQVTLATAASTTTTNNYLNMGTDNTAALNSAISFGCSLASLSYAPATVFIASGKYLSHPLSPVPSSCSGLSIRGASMYTSALILAPSSNGALLTWQESGTPSTIQDIGLLGAFGGTNQRCLDLENANGVTIAHNWFSACSTNVYVNGGSDIQIHDNLSELASSANYEVTNSQSTNLHDNVSYESQDKGYYIHDGQSSSPALHASPVLINNNRDEESFGTGFYILNYNDVMMNGAMAESANEQKPVAGIVVYGSNRVKISQAHVTHTGQYGIEVLPGSSAVDIDTPNIDAVGDYVSPSSVAMAGIYVPQGSNYISIHGGSITNGEGDCINDSSSGDIYGVKLVDCALGNSSTYGTASIELGVATANALDTVLVSGNTIQNSSTRGTAVLIDSGNKYQIIGNYAVSGFSSTYTNNSSGTGISACMNINISGSCSVSSSLTASGPITAPSFQPQNETGNQIVTAGQITTANPKQLLVINTPGSNTFDVQVVQQSVGYNQTLRFNNAGGLMEFGLNGTAFNRIAQYTASLTPASVGANTCAEQTFSVTGIQAGDIIVSVEKPSNQAGLSYGGPRAAGANSATVNFCNNTGSPITPNAGESYIFTVIK